MMPAARAAPPPLAARLLLLAVAAPLLPTGAARGACHCGCCEVEVRRGQDSLEGSGRLECTYAEPGLRYASPFRAPAAACESLCLRPAADQVLTAVEAPDMDTQRFCFFECKPSRNITEGAGKEAPRRGAQRPDWRGAACEPLGLPEAQEVRDPSGNALPPMEQAHLVASFLPGGARGSASAAGGPASRQPGPAAERPEGERFGAALAALRAQGAQLAELAGRATEAAAEAAQAARRTEELSSREDAALSAGRAAVEDARRAAQRALRAESQARALRDRVRQEVRQEALSMVPQVFAAAVAALLYYAPWPPPVLLNRERQEVTILDVIQASHDTKRFRVALGAKGRILGLPVGKSIIVYAPNPDECVRTGEWNGRADPDKGQREVDRSYTPITGDEVDGYFDLLVKIYKPGTTRTSEDEQVSWTNGGKVSQYLDSKNPGDVIEINGPRGGIEYLGRGMIALHNRTLSAKHICMLAGGTGITPMVQVLRRAIRDKADYCRFTLIYANKTEEDILLRDVLDGLVNEGKGQFNVVYTLDFPPAKWKEEKGHISAGLIRKHFPPPRRKSFDPLILMCGPVPMVELACRKNLLALGYPSQSLVAF